MRPVRNCVLPFALFLCGLSLQAANAQGPAPAPKPEAEVLKKMQEAQQALTKLLSTPPPQCTDVSSVAADKRCSFKGLCDAFSANRGGHTLYTNSKGQSIPNYGLQYAEYVLNRCYEIKGGKTSTEGDFVGLDVTMGATRAHQINILAAQRKFFDSVKKNKETKTFDRVYDSLIDELSGQIPPADAPPKFAMTPLDADSFVETIKAAEKRAKRSFSDQTRKLFAAYLAKSADSIGFDEIASALDAARLSDPRNKAVNEDPLINTRLLYDVNLAGSKEKVLANQKKYQAEIDRATGVYTKTVETMVARLRKSETPENSAQIESMVTRLNSVTLTFPGAPPLGVQMVDPCPGPNAFYGPLTHEFTLCPQILMMPDETLKMIIAHELGHSIDPCNAGSDLLTTTGTRKKGPFGDGPDAAAIEKARKSDEEHGRLMFIPKGPAQRPPEVLMSVDLSPDLTDAILHGNFEKYDSQVTGKGFPLSQNPFSSVLSCLRSPQSVGATGATSAQMLKDLDEEEAEIRRTGATEDSRSLKRIQEARSDIPRLMDKSGGCAGLIPGGSRSQLQEAFGDWIAGEVVAADMHGLNEKDAAQKSFEAAGFFLSMSCANAREASEAAVTSLMSTLSCSDDDLEGKDKTLNTVWAAAAKSNGVHPRDVNRAENLLMLQPEIRAGLGCKQPPEGTYCE